ncbi:MAG: inositol monophosphatase [Bacteroidales bacterium]|nr:inositol monophosphatase [Bacteroidales bacterium]
MTMDLKRMTEQVCALCREVGAFIDEQARRFDTAKVEFKGPHDYVSYVDKTSEQRLTEGLSRILPEAGFLAEEGTRKEGERFTWIIDPLDGTTNFIHGVPVYAISIALLDKQAAVAAPSAPLAEGGIVLGVIYHVPMRELFYACTGEPTRCNGREARVSPMASFDNALLATGFPYYDYSRLPAYMKLLEYTMLHTAGIRRLGSAALDLAYVACGRCELFYEYGLRPWDVAAGLFLVQQAGGTVTDFSGGGRYLFDKEIVATNGPLHAPFLDLLKQHGLDAKA